MKNIKKIRLVIYVVLGSVLLFQVGFRWWNSNRIETLSYGIEANALRQKLHIPLIESDMEAKHNAGEFNGNRWEADQDFPQGDEVLHAWKQVVPGENSVLYKETDAFRRAIGNNQYEQLTLFTTVENDASVTYSGVSIILEGKSFETVDRNKKQYDSSQIQAILRNWRIE